LVIKTQILNSAGNNLVVVQENLGVEWSSKPWIVCVATRTTVWGYRTQVRKMLTGMALEIFVIQMLTTMEYSTAQWVTCIVFWLVLSCL